MPKRDRQASRIPDERPPRRPRSTSDDLEEPNWYPDLELQEEPEDSDYPDEPQAMAEEDPLGEHSVRLEPLYRQGRDPQDLPRHVHSRHLDGLTTVAYKFYSNMAAQSYYQA